MNDWPKYPIPKDLNVYFSKKNSLSIDQGCIFYGNRIVIPTNLENNVLSLLHTDHIRVVRMQLQSRNYCWFPGIDKMIEDFVKRCSVCQMTGNKTNQSETISWPKTSYPFERVHTDMFYFEGKTFLICVDDFSKWMYVTLLKGTCARSLIEEFRKIFAFVGFPKSICSDNGPPYNGFEYVNFLNSNGIEVIKSPPYHPQSNGLAERAVQTAKQTLKKLSLDVNSRNWTISHKVSQFLFRYNNTPTTSTNQKPNDLIFKLTPKTEIDQILPISNSKYNNNQNKIEKNSIVKNNVKENIVNEHKSKENKNFWQEKKLQDFKEGEIIYYKNNFKNECNWIEGYIKRRLSKTVYLVDIAGSIRTAHAAQLKSNFTKSVQFSPTSVLYKVIPNNKRRRPSTETDSDTEPVVQRMESLRRSKRIRNQQKH